MGVAVGLMLAAAGAFVHHARRRLPP